MRWVSGKFLEPQEAPSSLPLLPACSSCSQSIPGSLEPSWSLRKPPAYSPCSQITPLAPRGFLDPWSELGVSWSEPNVIPGPQVPETFLEPQKAPRSLLMLPDCSPCCQLTPLTSRASLGLWNLPGASGSSYLTPLAPSSLPLLPGHPWVSGVS